ncbi:uncharacterized protein F4822DRAFT_430361 [Hypoxylon trugodes]|uniref:uncharacterized protein n=1 Tax=Hypoxylon trugodes TaxID=326681 RepID=UPI002196B19A|nr:uncharacterized protein F4822DRAFT_430361 [Hypoxylon trugodes]KAI1387614.1 hypothetical protein F4822DRAFT_430361 [Hypoxylon trugodes]
MGSQDIHTDLPNSDAPELHLSHPTENECVKIWTNTSTSWGDSLELPEYLEESLFLTTIPLAKDGGMTTWILVDKNLPPDNRPIVCSCESFYKRSLTSDADGNVEDVVVHGIASVFCPEEYRGRGYAARHMKELARLLRNWQSDYAKVVGSVSYSDIEKAYYAKLGWIPNPTNMHFEFPPLKTPKSSLVEEVTESDLPELCRRDEIMIREAMAAPAPGVKKRVTILPDLDHMLWHIRKGDFATRHLFDKIPQAKGAIAGPLGKQVWAIWTHRYYGRHDAESPNNVLYILRLVVEGDMSANQPVGVDGVGPVLPNEQSSYLEAVLQAAQAEAAERHLDSVKLWEPSPWVQRAIKKSKIDFNVVEREEDSIASGMWYGENGDIVSPPIWINNEHYAWC